MLDVADLNELKQKGCLVVQGFDRKVALFYDSAKDEVHAVDNRCPHLGFPLDKGTVQDGILVCHWHHARFDLKSGCTFDLFADDVPAFPTVVKGDRVYLARPAHSDPVAQGKRRLREGMEQNIGLIICKSILSLMKAGVPAREIAKEAGLFGVKNRDGWGQGLTILQAMANVAPRLPDEIAYLALAHGCNRVAQDCAGQAPRRERYPLDRDDSDFEQLKEWMKHWTIARHRDGAERTFLTGLKNDLSREKIADLLFTAATQRYYADVGHPFDFTNKAFEMVESIGEEHAEAVLPTVIGGIVGARGGEESSQWRYPIDLVPTLEAAFERIPALMAEGEGKSWDRVAGLADELLGDTPQAIIEAIQRAMQEGAKPDQLTKALAYAAALRIARFGTANEFGDWDTALHTFTYSNALHNAVKRTASPEVLRGVFHGAVSVYLDRYLNIPPARLPHELGTLHEESEDPHELLSTFLDVLNTQQKVSRAARITARYLSLGHPVEPLIATLAHAVVREDAAFHTFQMLEAGIRQYEEWGDTPEGRNILVAVARYIAAHAPTMRSFYQTADIARRLHRGDDLYEEDAA
ncbi:MAG: Rieske (2Fe-2S) protein [Armatimonadetes bacterium]|nr:Rieske (2Fe-2S) protein [Armatimonadota bacterium]